MALSDHGNPARVPLARMRAIALASLVSVTGCAFAVEHPAATAAMLGGTVGFTTCELGTNFNRNGTCAAVGGSAAALLGGVVLLALMIGGEGDTVLREPVLEEERPEPPRVEEPPTLDDASPPDASPPAETPPAPTPTAEPVPTPSPAPAPRTAPTPTPPSNP